MKKERTEDLERLVGIGRDLGRGRDLSSDARTWMRTVERASIDAAVSRAVPSESEAVRKAVARIALQRGWELASIALPSPFVKAEGANGGAGASAESNGALALSADALASGVPDDDVVLAYVRRGSLARYVEGVANSNVGFAEELRGVIDGLLEAGETVGDAARKWRGLASRAEASVGVAEAKPAVVVSLEAREKRRRTIFVVQFAVAATLVLGVGLYYVQDQRQKAAAVQAAKEKELEEKNAELARMMKDLEKQREIIAQAQAEAKMAQTDMERAEAQAKLAAAIESQRRTQANVAAVRAAASSAGGVKNHAKAACTCQAGDPLCSCL